MKIFDAVQDTITSIAKTYQLQILNMYYLNRHSHAKLRQFRRFHFHPYNFYFCLYFLFLRDILYSSNFALIFRTTNYTEPLFSDLNSVSVERARLVLPSGVSQLITVDVNVASILARGQKQILVCITCTNCVLSGAFFITETVTFKFDFIAKVEISLSLLFNKNI